MTSSSASPTVKPGSGSLRNTACRNRTSLFSLVSWTNSNATVRGNGQRKLDAFSISRNDLVDFIENPPAGASERYETLLKDLTARGLETYVKLDLSVVRGLAYYTGLVFEIFDTQRSLRAVAGGGGTTPSWPPSPAMRWTCPQQVSPWETPSSAISSTRRPAPGH